MLSYFNVELIRSIRASSHFLRLSTPFYRYNTRLIGETNTFRHREGFITRSVICLIALFIVCQVPASILHYIYLSYRNHKWLYICYDISNFLIFFNSAVRREKFLSVFLIFKNTLIFFFKVDFFIFTFFNRKFRRELTCMCFRVKTEVIFFFCQLIHH